MTVPPYVPRKRAFQGIKATRRAAVKLPARCAMAAADEGAMRRVHAITGTAALSITKS
jgi:hypothetical protein